MKTALDAGKHSAATSPKHVVRNMSDIHCRFIDDLTTPSAQGMCWTSVTVDAILICSHSRDYPFENRRISKRNSSHNFNSSVYGLMHTFQFNWYCRADSS